MESLLSEVFGSLINIGMRRLLWQDEQHDVGQENSGNVEFRYDYELKG